MILPYRELATESDAGCDDGRGDGVVTTAAALGDGLAGTDDAGEPHATRSRPRPASNRRRMCRNLPVVCYRIVTTTTVRVLS